MLSNEFEHEENFSQYIKDFKLDSLGELIGKKLDKDSFEQELKADYGDHKGTLKVDLFGRLENGNNIIIENQYLKSNHDHLGKIFTYSTMFVDQEIKITDAVWIVEKVREEHYNAVEKINKIFAEKNIEFKIWLLVASFSETYKKGQPRNEKMVDIRLPIDTDFYRRGDNYVEEPTHKRRLDEFMPMLMEAIEGEGLDYKKLNRAPSTPHCINFTLNNKPYDYNIPFRVNKDKLIVEIRFTRGNNEYYKDYIGENWENIIKVILEDDGTLYDIIEMYNISYEVYSSYVKVYGEINADIKNEDKWSYYIDQAIEILRVIELIANSVERY